MKTDARDIIGAGFDPAFYAATYPPIPEHADPLDHFMTVGWLQGRDPSPDFSTFNYLLHYDDVLFRRVNPYLHYLLTGKDSGRQSFPHVPDDDQYLPWEPQVAELLPLWFDEEFYAMMNPDLAGARSLLAQYLVLGWVEGRDPNPNFSTHKYLWKYTDVWLAGVNPLVHFLRIGKAEGRDADPVEGTRARVPRLLSDIEWVEREKAEFDEDFYLEMNPSLRGLSDLFAHFKTVGWLEGRDPNRNFSVRKYLAYHRDVRDAGAEPLLHFLRFGAAEGRLSFPSEAVAEPDFSDQPIERTDDDTLLRNEFDEEYYLANYPELYDIADCFQHYMSIGWKEGKNPSKNFDTNFYLRNEGDIREAGINPFRHFVLHGKREGRRGIRRLPQIGEQTYFPKLSVIIPNYNHARFLPERLQSIVDQNYPNLELIVLDDCSTDNSRDVLQAFAENYPGQCRLAFNEKNSGNVFSQWQKGLSLATGELIWICESDDTCDSQFLHHTVYLFQDPSLKLVFGNIQFIDQDKNILEGMDSLRESAEPGIWGDVNLMPAAKWFTGPLAVRNLIANVGGAVFRRPQFDAATWEMVKTYRVAGDWLLYLLIAGTGQIAYSPEAKAYFRQHGVNTSVTAFEKTSFYDELGRFHSFLRERWDVPLKRTFAFFDNLVELFNSSTLSRTHDLTNIVSLDRLIKVEKIVPHIAVVFINFNVGGGEIFPIQLLNALYERGFRVSAVVQTMVSNNDFVRGWLNPAIPVYASELSSLTGPELAVDAGFDIIHSHNIWSEFFILKELRNDKIKYVATLHGSYEVAHIEANQIAPFIERVSWAYLTDRNLEKFQQFGLDTSSFRSIPNGVSRRLSPTPVTRAVLDIPASALVFLFAARSHPEKGWLPAAKAFDQLCNSTKSDIYLVMAGEGTEPEAVREQFPHNPRIKVLGFRSDVDDLLELADFMLIPSRFAGESMPLVLIQSILAHVPVIATDIGQIKDMLEDPAGVAGVTIAPSKDDDIFVADLLKQMRKAANGKLRVQEKAFQSIAKRFSMEVCLENYLELYGLTEHLQGQGNQHAA